MKLQCCCWGCTMILFYTGSLEWKVEASHRSLQVWEEAEWDETRAGVLTGEYNRGHRRRGRRKEEGGGEERLRLCFLKIISRRNCAI